MGNEVTNAYDIIGSLRGLIEGGSQPESAPDILMADGLAGVGLIQSLLNLREKKEPFHCIFDGSIRRQFVGCFAEQVFR